MTITSQGEEEEKAAQLAKKLGGEAGSPGSSNNRAEITLSKRLNDAVGPQDIKHTECPHLQVSSDISQSNLMQQVCSREVHAWSR